ncbi:MAG: hypothetical protein LBQ97_05160 [Fusobacteriaceae bacterium]|nr:hypothetical protein [Fusobacteriaceae bacterium]
MTKTKAKIYGVLSLLPLIYTAGFTVWFFKNMFFGFRRIAEGSVPQIIFPRFPQIFFVHSSSFLFGIIILIIFIVNIFKNPNIQKNERVLWLLVLLVGHMIALPIY